MITEPVALLLLALGWLLLPGLVVGVVIGLRGWLLAGAAPALSMGVVAGIGVVFAGAGISWVPRSVVLVLLTAAAVAVAPVVALRYWRERRWSADAGRVSDGCVDGWCWWHHAAVGTALLVAGSLGVRASFIATDEFTGVNQTWDALFHLGAVRLIAESGDPSPTSLAAIAAPASTDFYVPDAYHCVAALVYQVSGAPVVAVVNAMVAVLPLLFGLALVGLLRVATGRPAHVMCVALLSACVVVVPYHMVGYGTLLPYATALVMLPGVLALVVVLLRAPGWRTAVALGIAAAGLLHAHPQVAFLAAMIALIQLSWHLVTIRRGGMPLMGALGLTVAVAAVLGGPVLGVLLSAANRASEIDWPAHANAAGAVGELLIFNAGGFDPQWMLALLLLVGFAAIVARHEAAPMRPFVAAAGVIGGLFVLAAAYDTPLSLRLTSLWWNDRHRLAAAFAVLATAFAAIGLVWLCDRLVAALHRHRLGALGRATRPAVLVVVLAVAAVLTGGGYVTQTTQAVADAYDTRYVLSDTERAGLAVVDRIVRAGGGGMVMNDPHDGCGWGYALYGTAMVFPTPLTGPFGWDDRGHDRMRLHDRFDQLDTSEQISTDVEALDIRWAVLCTGFIRHSQTRAPGLYNVGGIASSRHVYANDEVRLFRIDPRASVVETPDAQDELDPVVVERPS